MFDNELVRDGSPLRWSPAGVVLHYDGPPLSCSAAGLVLRFLTHRYDDPPCYSSPILDLDSEVTVRGCMSAAHYCHTYVAPHSVSVMSGLWESV